MLWAVWNCPAHRIRALALQEQRHYRSRFVRPVLCAGRPPRCVAGACVQRHLAPFLVATGPGFGNTSPIVTFPTTLTAFPADAGGTPSVVVFSPTFRNPYVEQGSFGIDHQFGAHTALSVSYAYAHGLALLGNSNGVTRQANGNFGSDLNLVSPDLQPQFGGSYSQDTVNLPNSHSYVVPDYEDIDGAYNADFGPIDVIDNTGNSKYNACAALALDGDNDRHAFLQWLCNRQTEPEAAGIS